MQVRSLGPALMSMRRSVEFAQAGHNLVYGLPNARAAAEFSRDGLRWLGGV